MAEKQIKKEINDEQEESEIVVQNEEKDELSQKSELKSSAKADYLNLKINRKYLLMVGMGFIVLLLSLLFLACLTKFEHSRRSVELGTFKSIQKNLSPSMDSARITGNNFRNSGRIVGKVTAVTESQLTIDVDGESVIVKTSDRTRFMSKTGASVSVGDSVTVMGHKDSDGNIEAIRIAIAPVN